MKLLVFLLLGVVFLGVPSAFAQSPELEQEVREKCYLTLRENMNGAGIFVEPLKTLESIDYKNLESLYSRNYKSLSSFGIEIDRPDFEMRTYSFGRETGYVHPPKTIFPITTKSETWESPLSEFVVLEEYVVDPKGKKHFIDCGFIQIRSGELDKVTRANYLSDGSMVSLRTGDSQSTYKTWYSENVSYDYENKPVATWKRLFVLPKETQNSYFSKYDIIDAQEARASASLSVLNFYLKKPLRFERINADGTVTTGYKEFDEGGNVVGLALPPELEPFKDSSVTGLIEFYQAIQSKFPEFGERLSIRGTLAFDTFKSMTANKQNLDPQVVAILAALTDFRELMFYAKDKEEKAALGTMVSDEKLDLLLTQIADANVAIQSIISPPTPLSGEQSSTEGSKVQMIMMIFAVVFVMVGIAFGVYYLRKPVIKDVNEV